MGATKLLGRRWLAPALVLGLAAALAAPALPAQAAAPPGFSVGILPFQDVSGNTDLGQLASVLPGMLQSVLLDKTQLVPRQIPAPPGQSVDVATASTLGQQAGTDVMVIGTLLTGTVKTSQSSFSGFGFHGIQVGGNGQKISVTVMLQLDLVDVNRGTKIATLRAKGTEAKAHFDPSVDSGNYGTVNMQSAGFQNSALGQATNKALVQLAQQMVRALSSFQPATPAAPAAAATAPAPAAPAAAATAASVQPNLAEVKVDFVPGEKTIFYDDFTDMAPDEPPPHWKVRGGEARLLVGANLRELDIDGNTSLTSPALPVPANFTLQSVLMFPVGTGNPPTASFHFKDAKGNVVLLLRAIGNFYDKEVDLTAIAANPLGGTISVPNVDFSQPVHLDLWIQNGRFRVYVNGNRAMDMNQVSLPAIQFLKLWSRGGSDVHIGIRRVRLAESAPDFAAEIQAAGKYVTHNITFATGSAILKPGSAAIMRQVADGLIADPNLKLEIDGYTDSVGGTQQNLTLSQQRADAVRTVLVSQFGVAAGRLTAKGMGPANPIGSNDTAAGRAENRRVEFVQVH